MRAFSSAGSSGAASASASAPASACLSVSGLGLRVPHGRRRPFHQMSTCNTQSTFRTYEVQIWSRGGHIPLGIEGNETLVLHRVDASAGSATASASPAGSASARTRNFTPPHTLLTRHMHNIPHCFEPKSATLAADFDLRLHPALGFRGQG